MTDPNALLDIRAAAELLQVSETSLRRWTNAGLIPCLRVGKDRRRRFRRGDLISFMEQSPATRRPGSDNGSSAKARYSPDEPVTIAHGDHLCAIYGSN